MSTETQVQWDSTISPKRPWFKFNIREIWQYRDLLMLFVRRDFVAGYKQTILGPLWFFIQPILTTITFTVIFGKVAQIPTDGLPQLLFYMTGVTAWSLFAGVLNGTSNTFVQHSGIFNKVYFPRMIMPLTTVCSQLIQFTLQMLMLGAFMLYFWMDGKQFSPQPMLILLLPVVLVVMISIGLGIGVLISAMTTKYRDLRFLVGFGIQLFMYATPIIYSLSYIQGRLPEAYRWLPELNPISTVIEYFKLAFLGVGTVTSFGIVYTLSFSFCIVMLGFMVFHRVEKSFVDTV